MKCVNCPAMQGSDDDFYCVLNMDTIEFQDGSIGCPKRSKTIKKGMEECNKEFAKECGNMFEFFTEEGKKDKAMAEAINRVLFSGNNCLCSEYPDGMLVKQDADFVINQHVFEIRDLYEKLLESMECAKDSEETGLL